MVAGGGILWRIPRGENSYQRLRPANSVKTVAENHRQAPISHDPRVATLL